MGRRLRARGHERGAAAVEFALVVIPLLVLVFGIISFGYMLSFRQGISQAAAEGARAAAVAPSSLTTVEKQTRARDAINAALDSYGVTCTSTGTLLHSNANAGTCTVSAPQTCTGSTTSAMCIKVTLDYLYSSHSLLPDVTLGFVLPDHLNYTSEVQVS